MCECCNYAIHIYIVSCNRISFNRKARVPAGGFVVRSFVKKLVNIQQQQQQQNNRVLIHRLEEGQKNNRSKIDI